MDVYQGVRSCSDLYEFTMSAGAALEAKSIVGAAFRRIRICRLFQPSRLPVLSLRRRPFRPTRRRCPNRAQTCAPTGRGAIRSGARSVVNARDR